MRVQEIVSGSADSLDGLISLNAQRSELAGIQYAANLPQMMFDQLDDEIKAILDELEDDENV